MYHLDSWKREEQQPFTGWNFSYLAGRYYTEKPPWSYEALVRAAMAGATSVLDIGTGGGEKLAQFKALFPARVVATEGYPPNVHLARERLTPLGVMVVDWYDDENAVMPFADAKFDLIIDRHSAFPIAEIERVLKPGGVFLTQQVDGLSLSDLAEAFGQTCVLHHFNLGYVLDQVKTTHLQADLAQEWAGRIVFKDVGALVYYLKATPWTVERFSVDSHLAYLEQQQTRLEREGELAFQWKLFLLKVKKCR